jgi:hypothetical protein
MQVSLGRRLVVEEKSNVKGSTPDVDFKVELPDIFTLYFIHECGGVYSR